jgi:hypothetical protein
MNTKTSGTPTPLTPASGAITTGGTAQTVFERNPRRTYLLFQNTSPNLMMLTLTGETPSATVGLALSQYAGYEATSAVSNGEIRVWSATTGSTFHAVQGS